MKKPPSVLEYPVVVAKRLDQITVSIPDLGEWVPTFKAPEKILKNNRYVTLFTEDFALQIGKAVIAAWKLADDYIQNKKRTPEASRIKEVLSESQKDLTISAFAKAVNKSIKISQDTLRRDLDRGLIDHSKTTGKHRRIPASEVGRYIRYLELKARYRPDYELVNAMKRKDEALLSLITRERKKKPSERRKEELMRSLMMKEAFREIVEKEVQRRLELERLRK